MGFTGCNCDKSLAMGFIMEKYDQLSSLYKYMNVRKRKKMALTGCNCDKSLAMGFIIAC